MWSEEAEFIRLGGQVLWRRVWEQRGRGLEGRGCNEGRGPESQTRLMTQPVLRL